jgi:hypothetical protein
MVLRSARETIFCGEGMASAVQEIIDILDLEPLEVNLFRGRSPQSHWQRVFGGQVIGQALVAACRTVDDVATRPPHSLHAYFLLGGDPEYRLFTRSTVSATARASPRATSRRSSTAALSSRCRYRFTAPSRD